MSNCLYLCSVLNLVWSILTRGSSWKMDYRSSSQIPGVLNNVETGPGLSCGNTSVASLCSGDQVRACEATCELAFLSHLLCRSHESRDQRRPPCVPLIPNSWADRDDRIQPQSQLGVPAGSAGPEWPGGKDSHFPCRSSEVRMGPQRSPSSPRLLEHKRHTGILSPSPPASSGSARVQGRPE